MPTVESRALIQAPLESVFTIARDIEAFPEFMPDVQEVRILEQDPTGRQVSCWVGLIKEFKRTINWTEEDYWDASAHVCTFRQLEGDFALYQGRWDFLAVPDGTEMVITLEYDYQVPLIGNLIKGLLLRKMQENTDNMLAAIKARAEQPVA
jgi:ribosome-associated toxin RatA of RatAB toxin-antitoxin module